jgi:glucose/arabinose dehydrogenase
MPAPDVRSRRRNRSVWSLAPLEPRVMLAGDAGAAVASSTPALPAAEVSLPTAMVRSDVVVFVDSAVSELLQVAQPLAEGAELILLPAGSDGVQQIRDYLAQRQNVRSVHILAHGTAGQLQLGSVNLSADTLAEHANHIRDWSVGLARGADVMLYGCDVASNSVGRMLIQEIARLSGADVAASTDRTANVNHGGDWELEYQVGSIDSTLAISQQAIDAFAGHLAIEIRAAGSYGNEEMQLQIGNQVVQTWTVTNTGLFNRQFQTYVANIDGANVNDIRINFTNSIYDPSQNIDSNLGIDWIRVDGVQYQTEAPEVFSTGTWLPGIGITPGYKQSEILHDNGYFQYAGNTNTGNGSTIRIFASGDTGDESMELRIDGQTVASYSNVPTTGGVYTYVANETIDASRVQVALVNSVYQAGYDQNLGVDRIEIDGVTYESEDPSVFSTAGFVPGVGLTSGYLQQQKLYADGYFQYASADIVEPPPTNGLIGYWKLDDTSFSGAIDDSSSQGNDGQAINFASPSGPTSDSADVSGNQGAFRFDGVNDYINVGQDESLRLTNGTYSQALWVNSTSTDDLYHGVIGFQAGTQAGQRYPFIYVRNGAVYAGFGTGGNTWKGVVTNRVINTGTWSHIAVTFDGTTMQVLVNGEVVGTNSNFAGSLPTTQYAQLNIGRINNYFAGQIDEVRMYNRALSQSEVQTLLNADVPTNGVGEIGLAVTQVTVNEDSGTASIGLRRTGGTRGVARVFYQTQDATAISGTDYVGTASGTVLFADGQDFGTITVSLIDDALADGEKNFKVSLFRVEGAMQGEPRTATVTIVDDESGSGLIGYWKLNETALGAINDSSGLGNHGQTVNIAAPNGPSSNAPDTDSPNPGSFRFDGVNDYINVPVNESLRLTEGTYSQALWLRSTSTDDNYHGVIGYQAGTNVGTRYPFIYVRNDAIYAGFGTGGNTWKGVIADNVITINAWNHVAVSFDGTRMQLFVNGEVVATNNAFAGYKPPTVLAQLNIGRINNQFAGQIDEVSMYDRAISGAEVANLIDGATLPPPQVVGFFTKNVLASGFVQPTTVERLPNGSFLVAERAGIIRLVNANGTKSSTPFLDINDIVNRVGVDRGVMSIAIGPDFAETRQLYVAYTYDPPEVQGRSGEGGPDGEGGRVARVSRFTVNATFTQADRNSEVVVLGTNSTYENIGQPNRRPLLTDPQSGLDANGNYIEDFIASDELSHTIGDMEFGADGALYVSTGDGGSYGRVDPVNLRALNLNSLNGKILRVDPVTGKGLSDNPFFDGNINSNASRVYSYGLRNPFRFAINPNDGEVFIGDVGWLNWEEVNTGRGKNFGWPAYEGFGLTGGDRGSYSSLPEVQAYLATNPVITPPIWTRSHAAGGTAIIMGDFIQGGAYPASLQGAFLFTDIGDQVLRAGRLDGNGNLIDVVPVSASLGFITDVMRMSDGSLYYVDFVSGTLGRLNFNV